MSLFSWKGISLLGGMIVVGVAIALGAGQLFGGGGGTASGDQVQVPADVPFDLAGQPAEIVARYHFAESHPELMSRIPCYCGCGNTLGHTNLFDCFVRRDGRGYDSHASTCMICDQEALDVEEMLAAGKDAPAIREAIDQEYSKYGAPTNTPKPAAAS